MWLPMLFAQGILKFTTGMVQLHTFMLFKCLNIFALGSRETPEVWVTKTTQTKRNKDRAIGENLDKRTLLLYMPDWIQSFQWHSWDEAEFCPYRIIGSDTRSRGHQSRTAGSGEGEMIYV